MNENIEGKLKKLASLNGMELKKRKDIFERKDVHI